MRWEQADELHADPVGGPAERGRSPGARRSIWPALAVTAAAATFGGVIWYAYQNARESSVSDNPPLVKADEGPVKVKPDQPGGADIPFQDSTVYDRLGQNNGKAPAVEKLLPPPETPVDRPQPVQVLPPPAVSPQASPSQAPAPQAPAVAGAPAPAVPGTPAAAVLAPPAASVQPAQAAAPPAPPTAAAQADPIGALAAAAVGPKPVPAVAPKPAVAPVSSGGWRIQLSAVRTEGEVGPEWARLKHRYSDTLAVLTMSAAKAEVPGKGTFFRIQAGPLDQAGAKEACDRLKAQNVGCIVLKP